MSTVTSLEKYLHINFVVIRSKSRIRICISSYSLFFRSFFPFSSTTPRCAPTCWFLRTLRDKDAEFKRVEERYSAPCSISIYTADRKFWQDLYVSVAKRNVETTAKMVWYIYVIQSTIINLKTKFKEDITNVIYIGQPRQYLKNASVIFIQSIT